MPCWRAALEVAHLCRAAAQPPTLLLPSVRRPCCLLQTSFQVFGMELLCQLDSRATSDFFTTFFKLPASYWRGFLASKLSSGVWGLCGLRGRGGRRRQQSRAQRSRKGTRRLCAVGLCCFCMHACPCLHLHACTRSREWWMSVGACPLRREVLL